MPVIRYMTPEEEKEWSRFGYVGFVEGSEVVISKSRSLEDQGSTIRHELGHVRYPVEMSYEKDLPGDKTNLEALHVEALFRELVANYYSLKLVPGESERRETIRDGKALARLEGLTDEMISRLDKVARERVGYQGKEVK